MPRPNDDRLVAYLDGEIDDAERASIEAWLDRDPAVGQTLAGLARSADLLRQAYDEVLREPVPDRLAAAVRGEPAAAAGARVLAFAPRHRAAARSAAWRWRAALPIAASLFGFLVGGGAAYFGEPPSAARRRWHHGPVRNRSCDRQESVARRRSRIFQAGGCRRRCRSDRCSGERRRASGAAEDQPKHHPAGSPAGSEAVGLDLPRRAARGARRPPGRATRLHDRQQSDRTDGADHRLVQTARYPASLRSPPRRQHAILATSGRAYVLVGQADIGYSWGIGNDVAWQLDAILTAPVRATLLAERVRQRAVGM